MPAVLHHVPPRSRYRKPVALPLPPPLQQHVDKAAGVLDAAEGEALKETAIAVVEAAADVQWMERAFLAVCTVARMQKQFTTDAVWVELKHEQHPREPRAMGAVIRRAAREHIIAPAADFTLTARPSRHRAPVQIWESLIYGVR